MVQRKVALFYLLLVINISWRYTVAYTHQHKCYKDPHLSFSSKTPCIKFYGISTTEATTRNDIAHICREADAQLAMPKTCKQIKFIKSLINVGEFAFVGAKFMNNGNGKQNFFEWDDGTHITSRDVGCDGTIPEERVGDSWDKQCVAIENKLNVQGLSNVMCNSGNASTFVCELCLTDAEIPAQDNGSRCTELCSCLHGIYCAHEPSCTDGCMLYQSPPENSETFPVSEFCDLKPCPSYRYGSECQFQCFCKDFQPCQQDSGQCPGSGACAPGWSGPSCNQTECSEIGRWGNSCEKPCSCASGQQCEKKTGTCFIGYACPPGQFGPHCESKCFCKDGGECTRWKGICLNGQCADGWEGASCNGRITSYNVSLEPRPRQKRNSEDVSGYCQPKERAFIELEACQLTTRASKTLKLYCAAHIKDKSRTSINKIVEVPVYGRRTPRPYNITCERPHPVSYTPHGKPSKTVAKDLTIKVRAEYRPIGVIMSLWLRCSLWTHWDKEIDYLSVIERSDGRLIGENYEGRAISGAHGYVITILDHSRDCTKRPKRGGGNQEDPIKAGSCKNGLWGSNCEKHCDGQCSGACRKSDGTCYSCIQGYLPGPNKDCRKKCPFNTWGYKCEIACPERCRPAGCDHVLGHCENLCMPGYWGERCTKNCPGCEECLKDNGWCRVCKPGLRVNTEVGDCIRSCSLETWGYRCEKKCPSNCIGGCAKTTGICSKCLTGYILGFNKDCNQQCGYRKWGEECSKTCPNECKPGGCSHITGTCVSSCDAGLWGSSCENDCSEHCVYCEKRMGKCITCKEGYQPDRMGDCELTCDAGFWGPSCDMECSESKCIQCKKDSGKCLSCQSGYEPNLEGECLETCNVGLWGEACDKKCLGKCIICAQQDGKCRACKIGYQPNDQGDCEESCASRKWGQNCTLDCPQQCGSDGCNKYNGDCLHDCAKNKWGLHCALDCPPQCEDAGCTKMDGRCKNDDEDFTWLTWTYILLWIACAILGFTFGALTASLLRKRPEPPPPAPEPVRSEATVQTELSPVLTASQSTGTTLESTTITTESTGISDSTLLTPSSELSAYMDVNLPQGNYRKTSLYV